MTFRFWSGARTRDFKLALRAATFFAVCAAATCARSDDSVARRSSDDGMPAGAGWAEPMQPTVPPGVPLFTFGIGQLKEPQAGLYVDGFSKATAGPVGICVSGPGVETYGNTFAAQDWLKLTGALRSRKTPLLFYSQYAAGYLEYLRSRHGLEVNSLGLSFNADSPGKPEAFNSAIHSVATASPPARAMIDERVNTLAKLGIGDWVVADYVVPYFDWGYSPASIRAYQDDLEGGDEGVRLRGAGATTRPLHFAEYFRLYNGFDPAPKDVGIAKWDEFVRPRGKDAEPMRTRGMILYWHLAAYEWLKAADRAGGQQQALGGRGLWIMPNAENIWSPDFALAARTQGVAALVPEWFGQAALDLEAAWVSWPSLAEQAKANGTRITADLETGYGGHGDPYWAWQYAYTVSYGLAATMKADNVMIDFLDETPLSTQSDPANVTQFARFRDGVSKAAGFRQAWSEKAVATVPSHAPIVSISDRPVGRNSWSCYFTQGKYALGYALSRSHLPYQATDFLGLEDALKDARTRVVVYTPMVARAGDWERLTRWLAEKPGRTVVTHSFVPTRNARDFLHADRATTLGAGEDAATIGLGKVVWSSPAGEVHVSASEGAWASQFPAGKAVVTCDKGRLVSEIAVGQGRIVYLHWSPSYDGSHAPESAAPDELGLLTARVIGDLAGALPYAIADAATPVQTFDVPGGQVVLGWSDPELQKVRRPDTWMLSERMPYRAAGVRRPIGLPAKGVEYVVYDFWKDQTKSVAVKDGRVPLELTDATLGLWYVGAPSPEFDGVIAAARQTRARLKSQFEDGAVPDLAPARRSSWRQAPATNTKQSRPSFLAGLCRLRKSRDFQGLRRWPDSGSTALA